MQHGVDMNTSLLTHDGFPRADIDVAQSTNAEGRDLEHDRPELTPSLQFEPQEHASSIFEMTGKT